MIWHTCRMPRRSVARLELDNDPIPLPVEVEEKRKAAGGAGKNEKAASALLDNHGTFSSLITAVVITVVLLFATGVFTLDPLLGTPIPSIVGLSQQEAIDQLTEAGFDEDNIRVEQVLSEEVEAGDVAAVEPGEQTRVSLEDEIVLQVSRGGYCVVENYVGMTLSQLQQTFAENGVNIRIRQNEVARSDVTKGTILSRACRSVKRSIRRGTMRSRSRSLPHRPLRSRLRSSAWNSSRPKIC